MTGAVVPKKTLQDKPKENSLDFHLDIINKIDKLLAEHNLEPQPVDTFHTPSIVQTPPSIPIEPRPPLNKTLAHQEIAWEPQIQQLQATTQTIPEEFKTELTINPEFRFITRQELIDTLSQEQQSQKDHIEIIDVNALREENTTIQKNIDFMDIKNQTDEIPSSFIINDVFNKQHHHKKIEIIDARTLKQKIYEDALTASTKQAEQIDNKAKLYFLNKSSSDKKQKKLGVEQAYIPDDFEERWKKLKEKQSKDEEKQQQEEKRNKLLKQDPKKFEEIVINKTKPQEKKQGLFHQEKKIPTDIHHTEPNSNHKELEKEQMRLQRLEMRQARIEERLRKKREKHEQKIKQKQQQLQQKKEQEQQLNQKEDKKQPQKIEKDTFFAKEKNLQSLEFDEDVKKVLLMTDTLLEELPEDILTDFMHSEDFKLYAKVLNKYKAK
jgi:hypothetical protein